MPKRSRSRPSRTPASPEAKFFSTDNNSDDSDSDFEKDPKKRKIWVSSPPSSPFAASTSTSSSSSTSTSSSTSSSSSSTSSTSSSRLGISRGNYDDNWGPHRYFLSDKELEAELERMATGEFNWHPDIGKNAKADVWWTKENIKNKGDITITTYRCPHGGKELCSKGICSRQFIVLSDRNSNFEGGCKYAICDRMRDMDYVLHDRHDLNRSQGLPKYIKVLFTRAFLRGKEPKDITQFLRMDFILDPETNKKGIAVDSEMKRQIIGYRRRCIDRYKQESTGVSAKQGGTYGGIYTVLNKYKKENLECIIHEHTPYVLKEWVDSKERYVVSVHSSKNLLRNGIRMYGVPGVRACLEIDCTYRLMTEGFCLCVIGTVSVDQKFHVIAYAICNHENTAVFQFILRAVKEEIDSIAADDKDKFESVAM